MFLLKNKNLEMSKSHLETERCVFLPFSIDGRVDIHELQEEFCRSNKNLYVSQYLPNYEEEFIYVKNAEEKISK
jgi:hypothetical protein